MLVSAGSLLPVCNSSNTQSYILEVTLNHFNELNLAPGLNKAISGMNFTVPTPIQAQATPVALEGHDVLATAQTGSGKTAAFSIPILSRLLKNKNEMALILVPTRELATQVTEVIRTLSLYAPAIRTVTLIGGVAMHPQLRALSKGYQIIVATPGRLVDHLERRSVNLSNLSTLTLDEADRMLDMGFAPQLRQIFGYLPKSHQTLLFSATMPANIVELTRKILKDPIHIQIGEVSRAAPKIEQKIKHVGGAEKNNAILDEVNARAGSILIFVRTQRRTDRLAKYLAGYGLPVAQIHGGRSQGQRTRAITDFRSETVRILVATDIAARGIDIDHVAHVINYDLPEVPEDYVHRIGRTARAGREGQALSLISHEEKHLWKDIEKLLNGKAKVTASTPSGSQSTMTQAQPQRSHQRPEPRPQAQRPGSRSERPAQRPQNQFQPRIVGENQTELRANPKSPFETKKPSRPFKTPRFKEYGQNA